MELAIEIRIVSLPQQDRFDIVHIHLRLKFHVHQYQTLCHRHVAFSIKFHIIYVLFTLTFRIFSFRKGLTFLFTFLFKHAIDGMHDMVATCKSCIRMIGGYKYKVTQFLSLVQILDMQLQFSGEGLQFSKFQRGTLNKLI